MEKQWLIKRSTGQIDGPFAEEDICTQINNLQLTGEELISEYPHGSWKSISTHKPFYDAFLSALDTHKTKNPSFHSSLKLRKVKLKTKSSNTQSDTNKSVRRKRQSHSLQSSPTKSKSHFQSVKVKHGSEKDTAFYVDMERSRPFLIKDLIKKVTLPLLVGAIMLGAFLFFYLPSTHNPSEENKVTLLSPRKGQPQKQKEETISRIKKGMSFYFDGGFSSYTKAQREWVQAIEGDMNNSLAMAYLCLAYYELWPYTRKQSKDIKMVSRITKKINRLDSMGIYSTLCQIVHRLIDGQEAELTKNIIASAIQSTAIHKHSENILPFFYYLKGQLYMNQQQYESALIALESAKTLVPKMIGVDMAIAEVTKKQNKWSQSLNIYSFILSNDPQHKVATLNKGVILYERLRKKTEGIKAIQSALSWKEPVLPHHLAPAYLVLAKNALQNKKQKEFLEYGKKSYALDPTNKEFHKLLKQSGLNQKEQIQLKKSASVNSQSLIQQGDQLEQEGLFLEARSHYQKAFEIDKNKNATAALKMGKNLWKFGFINESISWLKKAIAADPTYIKPYILLSNYYGQLYDFENASQTLKVANTHFPNNVEVLKGYASLLLEKGSFKLSIHYVKKALSIYQSDIESYVILSKIHEKLEQPNQSLKAISKALEIDSQNQAVQIQYARAKGIVYGTESATKHLTKLVSRSQDQSQRYINYILAFSQFLYDKKKYHQARSILMNLSPLKEKPIQYHTLMGQIYLKQPSTMDKAYEELIAASVISPSDPKIMFYLSSVLLKTKQYDEAQQYINKILRLYPRYPRTHYRLAEIFYARGGKIIYKQRLKK